MRRNSIRRYCRRVGRELICLPMTKQELLEGLNAELSALPPEETRSLRKIEAKYGEISAVAAELQEAVDFNERTAVLLRQQRFFRRWLIASTVVIVILLFALYFIIRHWPVVEIAFPPVYTS